jgi:hypothetical protein
MLETYTRTPISSRLCSINPCRANNEFALLLLLFYDYIFGLLAILLFSHKTDVLCAMCELIYLGYVFELHICYRSFNDNQFLSMFPQRAGLMEYIGSNNVLELGSLSN